MSQDPKRHHYIPEFFLKRWCKGGKLTRYVRTRRGIWAKEYAPKAVAFRTDLYKLRGIGIANPQGIETNFFHKVGILMNPRDVLFYTGNLSAIKFIQTNASATTNVAYYS